MLTMFVVGIGSVGWMLALAARDGRGEEPAVGPAAATPVGVALLGWAGAIVVANA